MGCVTPGSKLVATSKSALEMQANQPHYRLPTLNYDLADLGQKIEIKLDDKAQILDDGMTRRYARGFVLPNTAKPYSISLSSHLQGTLDDPAILYPELIFLDASYKVLRKAGPEKFSFRKGQSGDVLHGVTFINDRLGGERYLIVTSRSLSEAEQTETAFQVNYSTPVSVPVRGGVLTWMIPQGKSEPPRKMLASPAGKLEIAFEEYRLRKVGEKETQ